MAYEILKSDGTILLSLEDEQTTEISGIKLIGKNVLNYGKDINENYIKILENFAKNEPPSDAVLGQMWWDKIANTLKVNSSSTTVPNWKRIGHIVTSNVEPQSKIIGDLWWDTNSGGRLRLWDGSSWMVIGPREEDSGETQTGVISDVILDDTSSSHIVIKFVIADFLVAILSRDADFSPTPPITGFSIISRGLNISSQITDGGIRTRSITVNSIGIKPTASNIDIGDAVNKFRNIFATTFYGNSTTSSALKTARKINGTDFDGSSDITTTKWGTSRTISIGGTERSVDGSQNVSWSLSDIGLDSVTKDASLVGQVATFARISAPLGWLPCDGREVSRTTYSALFSAIGTLYGAGDGTTTFNVPDCRNEFFRGWTGNTDVVGTKFSDTYAAHNHTASSSGAGAHGHTASTASAGSHAHSASTTGAGAHTHSTRLGDAITSGEQSTISSGGGLINLYANVDAVGDHAHGVSVSASGTHDHSVSVTPVADHSHSITVNNSGSSETRPRGIYFLVCIRY